MSTWTLENADDVAAQNKYTFFKSPREAIALVRPGDIVKLIFMFESSDPEAPRAERMWVIVDRIDGDGRFCGRLDNQPRWIKDLKPGDDVAFDARHIINTQYDSDDNLVERYIKRCYVTQRVLRDGAKVGYLYREAPDQDNDSGWRFTAGDESDAYMDDADNAAYVSIGAVLSKDDSFIDLLDAPAGAAFQWDARAKAFVPEEDAGADGDR
jgi:hypothetical protein